MDRNRSLLYQHTNPKERLDSSSDELMRVSNSKSTEGMLINKLEDLQRTNMMRIIHKRDRFLNAIGKIYDRHGLQRCFTVFRKNLRYLDVKEMQLMKLHKKNAFRTFFRRWQQEFSDSLFENGNCLKALRFHEGLMKVRLKMILVKFKRVIKEEQRFLKLSKNQFKKSKLRRIFANWKLFGKYHRVKTLRKLRLLSKGFSQLTKEAKNKDQYLEWHRARMKFMIFSGFKERYLKKKL